MIIKLPEDQRYFGKLLHTARKIPHKICNLLQVLYVQHKKSKEEEKTKCGNRRASKGKISHASFPLFFLTCANYPKLTSLAACYSFMFAVLI